MLWLETDWLKRLSHYNTDVRNPLVHIDYKVLSTQYYTSIVLYNTVVEISDALKHSTPIIINQVDILVG